MGVPCLAVICAYPLLSRWSRAEFPGKIDVVVSWEKQSAASLVVILLIKFLRKENWDQWVSEAGAYTRPFLSST